MADNTGIEWTDATWNPLRGCTRISEGCRNCYAETVAARFSDPGQPYHGIAQRGRPGSKWTGKVELIEPVLDQPLRWKKPRRIFVNSMSDLFHESVPHAWIDRIFAVMALAPQHTFQVLTKRAKRMRTYISGLTTRDPDGPYGPSTVREVLARAAPYASGVLDAPVWPLPNVWLGVSVEHQAAADERIPDLLETSAAVRFLSCEPLIGPVDLIRDGDGPLCGGDPTRQDIEGLNGPFAIRHGTPRIDWVIGGGESGPNARPMHPDWARSIRDQCIAAGIPFFFKQWGEWREFDDGHVGITEVEADSDFADSLTDQAHHPGWITKDGDLFLHQDDIPPSMPCRFIDRLGKKAAGSMLDGRKWKEFPDA